MDCTDFVCENQTCRYWWLYNALNVKKGRRKDELHEDRKADVFTLDGRSEP